MKWYALVILLDTSIKTRRLLAATFDEFRAALQGVRNAWRGRRGMIIEYIREALFIYFLVTQKIAAPKT
jgi:hypothetical protein